MDRRKLINRVRNFEYWFLYNTNQEIEVYLWVEDDGSAFIDPNLHPTIRDLTENVN